MSAAAAPELAAGGVPAQPAASTAAAAAAQRRAVVKTGDCGVFMKASLSEKNGPSGQRSADDYFSTILKFATP
jgi:hypothetical protein